MKLEKYERKVEIPSEVEVSIQKGVIIAKGPRGETSRTLRYPRIEIEKENNSIKVYSAKATRNQKRIIGTFTAHIKNILLGAKESYLYKLKICSGHFPMKVIVEESEVVINNFLGEKVPRKARILEGIKVDIQDDVISVEGTDKEDTAQTAANIERSTRITNRDRRIFQDGCFIIEKAGRPAS